MENEQLKSSPLTEPIFDLENDEDEDDFENHADNMIFAMRTQAEFYGYPELMKMSKTFNSLDSEEKREKYLDDEVKYDVNPELEKNLGVGPNKEVLGMLFTWLSDLDQEFLVEVANLINDKNEQRTMLFEGMVYMGLAMEEDDEV